MIHQPSNIWGEGFVPATSSVGAFCDIAVPIGEDCKVQTGVSIPPGWKIGNRVFIGPGARFANDHKPSLNDAFEPLRGVVEDDVVIGMGALILGGLTLGKGCFIGAGAVVTHNVPPGETWIGNPAHANNPRRG